MVTAATLLVKKVASMIDTPMERTSMLRESPTDRVGCSATGYGACVMRLTQQVDFVVVVLSSEAVKQSCLAYCGETIGAEV